jgi:hypothetical protein
MSDITVTPLGEDRYGVAIREGDVTTNHEVRVPADLVEDLGLGHVDPERLVRESIEYLLEREPPTSIMSEFALTDIRRFFDDYDDEITARVGGP